PLGRVAIAAVGAGVVIAGVVHGYIAWTKAFQEHLRTGGRPEARRAVQGPRREGYVAKRPGLPRLEGLCLAPALVVDRAQPDGLPVVRRVVVGLGRVGYVAKGLALAVLGGLFVTAAITADPEEAGGLDEAFTTIGAQPFGAVLLVITGAGVACYGLFCFAQAR